MGKESWRKLRVGETWQAFVLPQLAAEAQTVCSQQYMHPLALFPEITVCVHISADVCMCVFGCLFHGQRCKQVAREVADEATANVGGSRRLSVGVSHYGAKCQPDGKHGANKSSAPTTASINEGGRATSHGCKQKTLHAGFHLSTSGMVAVNHFRTYVSGFRTSCVQIFKATLIQKLE